MRVQIAAKHIDITDEMKDYAEERAEKMARYFNKVSAIQVVLNRDGELYTAEMIAGAVRGKQIVCTEKDKDLFAALDLVTDKMERQLTKLKEKLRGHHVKKNGKASAAALPEKPSTDQEELGEDWL